MKTLIAALVLAVAVFTSSASVIYYNYSVAYTFLIQDQGSSGTATKYKIATKDILTYLSQSEFYAGNYSAAAFPTGSKLAYEYNQDTYAGRFVVRDAALNIICDVSDILSLDISESVQTGNATASSSYYQEKMIFDNTGIGLNLQFQITYLTNEKVSKGVHACKGTSGTGVGHLGSRTMVATGASSSTTK
jgi:hypothetical protein